MVNFLSLLALVFDSFAPSLLGLKLLITEEINYQRYGKTVMKLQAVGKE
jgi:hypothetical protein